MANLPVGAGHVLMKLTAPKSNAAILTADSPVEVTDSASLLVGSAQVIASSAHSTRFKISLANPSSFDVHDTFNISLFDSDDQLIKAMKKSLSIGAGMTKVISLTVRGQFASGSTYRVQID